MILPVILSGGSGTRLWPLSRKQRPKQLLPLLSQHSLFQETVLRLDSVRLEKQPPIVICNQAHEHLIRAQLDALGQTAAELVLEPEGRNTAPAATVAALLAERIRDLNGSCLLVLPADHTMKDPQAFAAAVGSAAAAAEEGALVTFGVTPTRPETGYGYIRRGESGLADVYAVREFVEKPDRTRAQAYVDSGEYYWNSGMFVFGSAVYLGELEKYSPEILACCRSAVERARPRGPVLELDADSFRSCPSDSIDYAVMERTDRAMVTPLKAGWSDVGSWASLHDACPQDADGNVTIGDALALDCRGSYLRADDRLVAGVGLEHTVVVDSPDALLVVAKDHAQMVKTVAERVESDRSVPGRRGARTRHSWGSEEVLHRDGQRLVRLLELKPGATLAQGEPDDTSVHWLVVSGTALVSAGDGAGSKRLGQGASTVTPAGERYRIENPDEKVSTLIAVTLER